MTSTFIDGHVHFYPAYSLVSFLNAARQNFPANGGVLLLAQADHAAPLALLERRLADLPVEWSCSRAESTAFVLQRDDSTIVLIAGRQVVTRENLEVLALCTDQRVAHRRTLSDTLDDVRDRNGVPVVPWGFGKWWFSRGEIVRSLIRTERRDFLLGDSGCRPNLRPLPLLQEGRSRGIGILAGTDPLPLPFHETRPGSLYTTLSSSMDLHRPTAWVREHLMQTTNFLQHGVHRNLVQCFQDQLRLRLHVTR